MSAFILNTLAAPWWTNELNYTGHISVNECTML